MSWNEPGGDKKDPWSGRGDKKGPPDLDEAIRSLQEKLAKFFGGGNGGNGDNEGSPKNFSPSYSTKSLGFLAGGAPYFFSAEAAELLLPKPLCILSKPPPHWLEELFLAPPPA